ncbi:MAG: TIGR02206 family membrane protein [Cyanobacteria bacterium SID2]|nr:TIGR02206 family membrane protein [Cyanobacteria bacterium SID2]MBP0004362.1 TIGR02206 family membrane protein [Cyanobacteria bacterium SBC]
MNQYFLSDYQGGGFQLLGTSHLVALAIVCLANLSLLLLRSRRYRKLRVYVGYGLVILLIASEAAWQIWNLWTGRWSIETMLPLELCGAMTYISALALVTQNTVLYPLCYFLGIGGAIAALLTPAIGMYGFPHFVFVQTFVNHGSIVTTGFYVAIVERYRPKFKDILQLFIGFNIYAAVVGLINILLGSNYLFLARKPESPTLFDMLPPWPWYLLHCEALVFLVFLFLYLPFAVQNIFCKKL